MDSRKIAVFVFDGRTDPYPDITYQWGMKEIENNRTLKDSWDVMENMDLKVSDLGHISSF